jgi:DNA-binding XRE family transcriptional regulator
LYKYTLDWTKFEVMSQDLNVIENPTLSPDSPEMRALRLKRVRNLANLNRDQMCQDGEIKRNTLIGWECARFGGLTTNGATKVLSRITREGVHCSLEWLMDGEGPEPSVNPLPLIKNDGCIKLNEDILIAYEIEFFKAKNWNTVVYKVDDEGMHPQYKETDHVAGKKRFGKDIQLIIGQDCIVETERGEILLRNIREGMELDTYTLVCNNPSISKRKSIILNVRLDYAAPVIWHRKKDG